MDDPVIICYQHRKTEARIYSYAFSNKCKICQTDLSDSELHIPPFRIPYPFTQASQEPCAVVIKPTTGNFLNDYENSSDLHIGVTDSKGSVYAYDYNGLTKSDGNNWLQCIAIKILHPSPNMYHYWDKKLMASSLPTTWSVERYDAEKYNCYTYVLTFLKSLMLEELNPCIKDKKTFCEKFVAPQAYLAAKYISLYRKIKSQGIFLH